MNSESNGAATKDTNRLISQKTDSATLPELGSNGLQSTLTVESERRALGVLVDPLVLKQVGAAVPLLAVINERCGDGMTCRIKYGDVANWLSVSVTTVKMWAETLAKLGYITREPVGPAGVDIQLCPDRWPTSDGGRVLARAAQHIATVLDAVKLTIDQALTSAVGEIRHIGEVAA